MPLPDEQVCSLYTEKRSSCAKIAEIDGRSETTIYNILRSNGVQLRNRSIANSKCDTRIIVWLYNLALSVSQIGRLLGLHSTTVLKRLESIGFPLRPQSTAIAVGYSEREFHQFFEGNETFRTLLRQAQR